MAKAEQRYFHLLGEMERSIGPTGGSWPGDVAVIKMEPILIEGLPGKLSFGYMLNLWGERIWSIFDPKGTDITGLKGTLPNLIGTLVYESGSERVMVWTEREAFKEGIHMILYESSNLKGIGGGKISYLGALSDYGTRPLLMARYLSPVAYKKWLEEMKKFKELE